MDYENQPYFVLNDVAYDRMHKKLKEGSRFEWSYVGTCPHPPGKNGPCVSSSFLVPFSGAG